MTSEFPQGYRIWAQLYTIYVNNLAEGTRLSKFADVIKLSGIVGKEEYLKKLSEHIVKLSERWEHD